MTQEERIELLKRVAEVAPKEMRAIFMHGLLVDAKVALGGHTLFIHPDFNDAQAVFAMLDAMEEDGYFPMLYGNGESYVCSNALYADNCIPTQSKTRAEAVARAFVEVFGK